MTDDDIDRPAVRNTDPDTSHAAWHSVEPHTDRLRQRVLVLLRQLGTHTTSEIANMLGMARDSISPRMAELQRRGLVFDTGLRRLNTDTNRRQIVWCTSTQGETMTDETTATEAAASETTTAPKPKKRLRTTEERMAALLAPAQGKLKKLREMEANAQHKLTEIQERREEQEQAVTRLESALEKMED